jgi:hypothetical protein
LSESVGLGLQVGGGRPAAVGGIRVMISVGPATVGPPRTPASESEFESARVPALNFQVAGTAGTVRVRPAGPPDALESESSATSGLFRAGPGPGLRPDHDASDSVRVAGSRWVRGSRCAGRAGPAPSIPSRRAEWKIQASPPPLRGGAGSECNQSLMQSNHM